MNFNGLRSNISSRLAGLSGAARLILFVIICALCGAAMLWLFNRVFYYFLARSYADEIAQAYDLNKDTTNAIVLGSFVLIAFSAKYIFSSSKRSRIIGLSCLFAFLIGHSLIIGHVDSNFKREGQAIRCYVLMRDSIKILNRAGIDPESGRQCRPLTPEIVEKFNLYKNGNRPSLITSDEGSFFDPLSGEPIAWYSKSESGSIELFDLMGFHPRTGEELLPVNRQVIEAWKNQNLAKIKRVPNRVDPSIGFFDPATGQARIWFWQSDKGDYEFYDGPGFQPQTGEALKIITKGSIAEWNQALEATATKKRLEQEQRDAEVRRRADLEQKAVQQQAERDRFAKQAELDAQQEREKAAADCDLLAANPTDARKAAIGVPFEQLRQQASQAVDACSKAAQNFPTELRYQYQLARATQFKDKKKAFELFSALAHAKYAAAFDNLGTIYLDRKDVNNAIIVFSKGNLLDDADSMVSLADLADRGYYPLPEKWPLLQKAAKLGHLGAQRAIAEEQERRANERAAVETMGQVFRGILQNVGRH